MKIFEVSKYCLGDYSCWIPNRQLVNSVEEADLVFFKGGEDVTPALYGEIPYRTTYNSIERDNYEIEIYNKAKELNKKMIGVCRGLKMWPTLNEVNSGNAVMPILS